MTDIRIIPRAAVAQLPEQQRAAYVQWLEGRSEDEIAVLMCTTRRQVLVWMYEARAGLRGYDVGEEL